MEKKFAKGPWYQTHSKDSDGMHTTKVYNHEHVIARFEWFPVKVSETVITTNREANAKLCAAAPDLLEALELILKRYTGLVESGDAGFWNPEEEPEVIQSRAAIEKATS